MLGHLGVTAAWHFFKIPFFFVYLGTVLDFKINRNLDKFSIALLIVFLFAFINGILNYGINKYTLSHIYFASLAFFGYIFGSRVYNSNILRDFKYEWLVKNLYILIYICFGYFLLHITGVISYFGISTNIGYVALLYFSQSKYKNAFLSFVATLATGKRTVLLSLILSTLPSITGKKFFIAIGIIITSMILVAGHLGLLDRIIIPLQMIIEDPDNVRALYMITSGRDFEVQYALQIFRGFFSQLFGMGFGVFYEMPLGLDDDTDVYYQHYTHFSVVSFAMLYGWLCTILFYLYVFWVYIKNRNEKYNVFLAYALISSFAGATLLVDSKVWIILGYFSARAFQEKNY